MQGYFNNTALDFSAASSDVCFALSTSWFLPEASVLTYLRNYAFCKVPLNTMISTCVYHCMMPNFRSNLFNLGGSCTSNMHSKGFWWWSMMKVPLPDSLSVCVFILQPCYQKARQWLLDNLASVLVFGVCIGVIQVGYPYHENNIYLRLD